MNIKNKRNTFTSVANKALNCKTECGDCGSRQVINLAFLIKSSQWTMLRKVKSWYKIDKILWSWYENLVKMTVALEAKKLKKKCKRINTCFFGTQSFWSLNWLRKRQDRQERVRWWKRQSKEFLNNIQICTNRQLKHRFFWKRRYVWCHPPQGSVRIGLFCNIG